jgi:hypothetical protein
MRLSFNPTGPCFPDEHYMLPLERRLGRLMELLAQHTAQTGQRFEPEAAARTFELSQGHP